MDRNTNDRNNSLYGSENNIEDQEYNEPKPIPHSQQHTQIQNLKTKKSKRLEKQKTNGAQTPVKVYQNNEGIDESFPNDSNNETKQNNLVTDSYDSHKRSVVPNDMTYQDSSSPYIKQVPDITSIRNTTPNQNIDNIDDEELPKYIIDKLQAKKNIDKDEDEDENKEKPRLFDLLSRIKQERIHQFLRTLKYSYTTNIILILCYMAHIQFQIHIIYFSILPILQELKVQISIRSLLNTRKVRALMFVEYKQLIFGFMRLLLKTFMITWTVLSYYYQPNQLPVGIVLYQLFTIISAIYETCLTNIDIFLNAFLKVSKVMRVFIYVQVLALIIRLNHGDKSKPISDVQNFWPLLMGTLIFTPGYAMYFCYSFACVGWHSFINDMRGYSCKVTVWFHIKLVGLFITTIAIIRYTTVYYEDNTNTFEQLKWLGITLGLLLFLQFVVCTGAEEFEDFFGIIIDDDFNKKNEAKMKAIQDKEENIARINENNIQLQDSIAFIHKKNSHLFEKFGPSDIKKFMEMQTILYENSPNFKNKSFFPNGNDSSRGDLADSIYKFPENYKNTYNRKPTNTSYFSTNAIPKDNTSQISRSTLNQSQRLASFVRGDTNKSPEEPLPHIQKKSKIQRKQDLNLPQDWLNFQVNNRYNSPISKSFHSENELSFRRTRSMKRFTTPKTDRFDPYLNRPSPIKEPASANQHNQHRYKNKIYLENDFKSLTGNITKKSLIFDNKIEEVDEDHAIDSSENESRKHKQVTKMLDNSKPTEPKTALLEKGKFLYDKKNNWYEPPDGSGEKGLTPTELNGSGEKGLTPTELNKSNSQECDNKVKNSDDHNKTSPQYNLSNFFVV